MIPKLVSEYRAQITHNHCVVTITGFDQATVQELANTLFEGRLRFDPTKENTTLIANEDKQVIGWIANYQVPELMSIRAVTEQRQLRAA